MDLRLQHCFICNECSDGNQIKIFYNDDDNVCVYCGSKKTNLIFQARLRGEILLPSNN